MVVVEKTYSKARQTTKKIFTILAVVFGFFVLIGLPSLHIPKFLGLGTPGAEGVAHADFTTSPGDSASAGSYVSGGGDSGDGSGGGDSGGGGDGSGCDSGGGSGCGI